MTVLGAHVPVSGWTLAVLVVGAALSLLLWRPLARRRDWRPAATLAALLLLTATLALTVTPEGRGRPMGLRACIPDDLPDLVFNIFHTGGGLTGDLLNLVLMLPLTVSLVLATRRVLPAAAVAVLLPFSVELVQTQLPGRSCAISDLVTNAAGALLGVALGALAQRLVSPGSPRSAAAP